MNVLVFDTETTGLANFKLPPIHESQPRIAQLGAILYNTKDWSPIVEVNLLVQPFGFDIPVEASRVHGITSEIAREHGVEEQKALDLFDCLISMAHHIVAHNIKYDALVMTRAYHVHKRLLKLYTKPLHCTMEAMTDICQIPSTWKDGYKWPTLQESHKHCFNIPFEGAHDAMADVRACGAVLRWLLENKHLSLDAN